MEVGNFWTLRNLMARDESPFPLTGLDKITLHIFSHPLQDQPLADTVRAGRSTHHPGVCLHEGERQP